MVSKNTFSIIVPVYNVAAYLYQCVDSILNQTYPDFELFLVNDGSTDTSLEICYELQKRDQRIVVINQLNSGASSARNNAISKASGDYLIFIDSDDYLESLDLFFKVNERIQYEKADIVLYGAKNYNTYTQSYKISKGNYNLGLIRDFDFLKSVKYLIMNGLFPGSSWVFSVKTSVVKQNALYFRTQIIAEDIDWVTKIFKHCKKVDAINDAYYVYRKNQPNSVTGNAGMKGIVSVLSIIEDWYPKLSKSNPLDLLLLHNLGYYYFTTFVLFDTISLKNRKELEFKMRSNFHVTSFVLTKKLRLLYFFCKLLGLKISSKVIAKGYAIKERLI